MIIIKKKKKKREEKGGGYSRKKRRQKQAKTVAEHGPYFFSLRVFRPEENRQQRNAIVSTLPFFSFLSPSSCSYLKNTLFLLLLLADGSDDNDDALTLYLFAGHPPPPYFTPLSLINNEKT
jgi:hypothetical protein